MESSHLTKISHSFPPPSTLQTPPRQAHDNYLAPTHETERVGNRRRYGSLKLAPQSVSAPKNRNMKGEFRVNPDELKVHCTQDTPSQSFYDRLMNGRATEISQDDIRKGLNLTKVGYDTLKQALEQEMKFQRLGRVAAEHPSRDDTRKINLCLANTRTVLKGFIHIYSDFVVNRLITRAMSFIGENVNDARKRKRPSRSPSSDGEGNESLSISHKKLNLPELFPVHRSLANQKVPLRSKPRSISLSANDRSRNIPPKSNFSTSLSARPASLPNRGTLWNFQAPQSQLYVEGSLDNADGIRTVVQHATLAMDSDFVTTDPGTKQRVAMPPNEASPSKNTVHTPTLDIVRLREDAWNKLEALQKKLELGEKRRLALHDSLEKLKRETVGWEEEITELEVEDRELRKQTASLNSKLKEIKNARLDLNKQVGAIREKVLHHQKTIQQQKEEMQSIRPDYKSFHEKSHCHTELVKKILQESGED